MNKVLLSDMEHILHHTRSYWDDVKGKTIFITGGTGFFGKWLLESFLYINQQMALDARLIVLSRQPEVFLQYYPHFNHPHITFIKGDITNFKYPENDIHFIIHAATEASVALNLDQPLLMFNSIVNGTKNILELARIKKVIAVLHTSSGAVYGRQPAYINQLSEDYTGSPDIFSKDAAYGEGKRVAEMLSNFYYLNYGVNSKIARCFAFIGPFLPLDGYFAAGNFINNIINDQDIEIKGDGTPYRSYLYASDLVIWLWCILLKGESCRPYNVGSDIPVSIEELANTIVMLADNKSKVIIKTPKGNSPPLRYVPAIERAKTELGLDVNISLTQALKQTIAYYTTNE